MSGNASCRDRVSMRILRCEMKNFKVMTYNVLAQSYARSDLYPGSPPEALDATRRHALLLSRIEGLDADLLCLQELEPGIHDALRGRLETTHHSFYAQRKGRPEGAAIFARRSRFDLAGHGVLRFEAHRPGDDDLALIATLVAEDRPLHVASVHLPFRPESTPRAEHTGCSQMLELIGYRDATAPRATWIFGGDFNATSQSVVLASALERGMEESCRTQRPWDTCAINGRPRKIDYLLFSKGHLEPHPGVLPRLYRDTALPSLTEPSDHLPLCVDFSEVPRSA